MGSTTPEQKSKGSSLLAHSITWILVFGFVVVAVVPVGMLALKLYRVAWDEAWREITEKHQLLAQNLAAPISIYVDDQRRSLGLLSDYISAISTEPAESGHRLTPEQVVMVEKGMSRLKGFRSLSVVDLKGDVVVSTEKDRITTLPGLFRTEACYVRARKEDRWFLSGVKRSPYNQQPTLFMSMPMHNHGGHQIGVLMGELRIDLIENLRRKIRFGKKGHSAIVDQTGHVVAHPNPDWMRDIKDISDWPIVHNMISGKTGVTEFYSPFMGAMMVAGYSSVPEINWGIMVPQPKPEVEAQVNRLLHAQLAWGGVGLVLALLIAYALVRWISIPLRKLYMAADGIVNHELQGSLPELSRHAPREIRSLRDRFATLVSRLQTSRNQLNQLNRSLQSRIDDATLELRETNRQLQRQASQDYLTKLANRRYFESMLLQRLTQQNGQEWDICLMLIDVDNFKPINDRYGHAAGDSVLVTMGELITKAIGKDDLVARYAGDEFVVLLTGDMRQAQQRAQGILDAVEHKRFEWMDETIRVTVSIGLLCHKPEVSYSMDILLQQVDEALYQAKETGRNRVSHIAI